jgi:hypothetical protein
MIKIKKAKLPLSEFVPCRFPVERGKSFATLDLADSTSSIDQRILERSSQSV